LCHCFEALERDIDNSSREEILKLDFENEGGGSIKLDVGIQKHSKSKKKNMPFVMEIQTIFGSLDSNMVCFASSPFYFS
jgi:hypothetical protein